MWLDLLSDGSREVSPLPITVDDQALVRTALSDVLSKDHIEGEKVCVNDRWSLVLLNPKRSPEQIESRNTFARNNPIAVSNLVTHVIKARAMKEGSYFEGNTLVSFNPSEIPFHLVYTILCEDGPVYHLVSGKNPKVRSPVSPTTFGFCQSASDIG